MQYLLLFLTTYFFFIDNATAYVGPGLGLGGIGAFIGIVVAVLLAIFGLIWYPLKRLFKGSRSKTTTDNDSDET